MRLPANAPQAHVEDTFTLSYGGMGVGVDRLGCWPESGLLWMLTHKASTPL